MDRELWRWVVGYEGLYMVSSMGNIIAVPHDYKDGLWLRPRKTSKGYLSVSLYKDGKYFKMLVHRAVAQAFIPNPNRLPQVNHIDGNKTNNNVNNLEWCTAQENIRHKYDVLGYSQQYLPSKHRRFTDEQVRAIRRDKRKPSVICIDYGVTRQCIADIQKGKYYKEVQ